MSDFNLNIYDEVEWYLGLKILETYFLMSLFRIKTASAMDLCWEVEYTVSEVSYFITSDDFKETQVLFSIPRI